MCRCVDSEQSACPSGCTVQRSTAALYSAQSDPVHQSTWASRSCHYISRLCVGVSCPHSQSRPGQLTQWSQETSSAVTLARTSALPQERSSSVPAEMASTGGGGGRWPSPAQNECFFMSPLQSYQGSYQGSFQGGNWRKQGGCNKYIFTNAKLPVVRPAVCWCGPLRRSSPDYITTNIKTLAFTGTRAMSHPPGAGAGYQGNFP